MLYLMQMVMRIYMYCSNQKQWACLNLLPFVISFELKPGFLFKTEKPVQKWLILTNCQKLEEILPNSVFQALKKREMHTKMPDGKNPGSDISKSTVNNVEN